MITLALWEPLNAPSNSNESNFNLQEATAEEDAEYEDEEQENHVNGVLEPLDH